MYLLPESTMSRFALALFFLVAGPLGVANAADTRTAVFAGGCFWCMEGPYDGRPGVLSTISGYAGGTQRNPTYEQVSAGGTGHYEVIEITYDPSRISYQQLVDIYWRNVDPFDGGGQFCDRGKHYASAIFAGNAEEREIAEASKRALATQLGKPIATEVLPATKFYAAEDYHQDYYVKNPVRYKYYRYSCGRDARLESIWGAAARGDTLPPKSVGKAGGK